jgi:hypothetical protein
MLTICLSVSFIEALTQAMQGLPNGTSQVATVPILVEDMTYWVEISPEMAIQFAEFQQAWLSENPIPSYILQAESALQTATLTLGPEDLKMVLFVIDKVIAGATAVHLNGEVQGTFTMKTFEDSVY